MPTHPHPTLVYSRPTSPGGTHANASRGAAWTHRPSHRVEPGSLVALPILIDGGGHAIDLLEVTEGHRVILLVLAGGSNAVADRASIGAPLLARLESSATQLFVIVPEDIRSPAGPHVVIDPAGRFAYMLGLAVWDDRRRSARLARSAGLALDEVGQVIAADFDGRPDPARLLDSLDRRPRPTRSQHPNW